jgi:ring-1,2-phenylacetyl-CoA epoxidase subunit PaaE
VLFNLFGKKKETPTSEKPTKYRSLTVRSVTKETADAISISFETPPEGLPYEAGQFLTLILDLDGEEVRRSYSLCTAPAVDPHPAVTVKRVASGKLSNYLNDALKSGDTLRVAEPAGTFTTPIDTANRRHLVMFGGGSGITPLMGLLKSVLHGEPQSRVSLVYANRSKDAIIFDRQLTELQQQYADRLHVVHVLEDPGDHPEAHAGQVLAERVPELLATLPLTELATEYYLCGPPGLMDNVQQALKAQDVAPHLIRKESFVLSKPAKSAANEVTKQPTATWDTNVPPGAYQTSGVTVDGTHEVTIRYEGETHRFAVEPDSTILQTALALDIELPYSCQSGLCTACMGKCVSGRMKLDEEDSLTEDDLKQGYVLTCVGHPLTDNVVIEIE